MPKYFYSGRDSSGHLHTGEYEAENIDILSSKLISDGITPIDIRQTQEDTTKFINQLVRSWFSKRVKKPELAALMHQLRLLAEAHVPILTGLELLSQHTKNTQLKDALMGICMRLQKGQSLASAMSAYPTIFSKFMISIIEIGEKTGNLSNTFEQIYEYLEFEVLTVKKVKETLRYPIFLLLTLISTILSINIFVIPTFAKVYDQLHAQLPWQTYLLITTSNFLTHNGIYIFIVSIISTFFILRYINTEKGRLHYHTILLKIPLIGTLLKEIIILRFSKTLSIVLSAGMTVLDGLHYTEEIVTNESVRLQINQACDSIERGNGFVSAITKISIFSPLEKQMIAVGEQNGKLAPALIYISTFYTSEIDFQLKRLQETLSPILVGCFAVVILIVALGVYLPLWDLSSAMRT